MHPGTQPLIGSPQGQSFLPEDAYNQVAQKKLPPGKDLSKFLHEQTDWIKKQDEEGYNRRHRRFYVNRLFWEGRQYGSWSYDGEFVDAVPTKKNQFYINNQFSQFVISHLKEWARAQTKLLARSRYESVEGAGVARIGTDILSHEQTRLRPPTEHQAEGLTAGLCGTYARYSNYSIYSGNVKGQMPRYKQVTAQMAEGASECLECGMRSDEMAEQSGKMPEMGGLMQPPPTTNDQGFPSQLTGQLSQNEGGPTSIGDAQPMQPMDEQQQSPLEVPQLCPNCGTPSLQQLPPVEMQMDVIEGYDEVNAGEIISFPPDPTELRVHPSARTGRIRTSPYVAWYRNLLKCKVKAAFSWADEKKMRGEDTSPGRRYIRDMERSGGALSEGRDNGSSWDDDDEATVNVVQVWMDREWYADITLQTDTPIHEGKRIPAGVPLGEIFPQGMCFIMAGSQLLDVWGEDKNKHWVFGVFHIVPTSFWGRGYEDAVQQQKLLNDADNLWVHWLRYCSNPTVIINSLFGFDVNQFGATPGEVISGSWDQTQSIGNGFLQVSPPAMPASITTFIQSRQQNMQAQTGAFSDVSGQPNVDISTATGIKILREQAMAIVGLPRQINAQVDAEWGQQILELAQKNWVFPHPVVAKNEYGKMETKWFSSADLDEELDVVYEEGSVFPKAEYEKRQDLFDSLNPGGVIPLGPWNPQLQQQSPDLVRALSSVLDLPFDNDRYAKSEKLAKTRLDALIEEAQIAMQAFEAQGVSTERDEMGQIPAMPLLLQLLQKVPIDPLMDEHPIHQMYLKNWIHTDDGYESPEAIKELVRARYLEHEQAKGQLMAMQNAQMVQAQMPAMLAASAAQAGAQPQAGPQKGKSNPPNQPSNPKPPQQPVGEGDPMMAAPPI